jgi:hypothetical protein
VLATFSDFCQISFASSDARVTSILFFVSITFFNDEYLTELSMIHSNTALTEEESDWINHCAGRLRLIQTDAAAAPGEKRREYLKEELGRCFQDVAPANRTRFLEALLARYPVAGQTVKTGVAPAAPAPAPAKPVPESVEQVAERLLAAAADLPEAKRGEITKRLSEGGLGRASQEPTVLPTPEDLCKRLGLKPDQQPHLARVIELTVFLVDAVVMLDQNALKTMRELSPRSPLLNRSEDFRKTAARFLTSTEGGIEQQWNAIRGLVGGLLAAIQGGGKDYGRQFVERMSPVAIEDVILSEGGKLFGPNKKERCWDRYKDLSEDISTPDLVDRKIKECFGAFVERMVHGNR